MLLPGPEAQQLATYVGWLLHRVRGGLVAGTPSCCRASSRSGALVVYAVHGDVTGDAALFFGLKAAVLGWWRHAAIRIGKRALKNGGWCVAAPRSWRSSCSTCRSR